MSKYTLDPDKVRFFVQPENCRVVCVIEQTRYTFCNFADDNCRIGLDDFTNADMSKLYRNCQMPNRFVGVATCSEEDEWDEDVGKLLAYHRARAKFDQSFFRHAQTYIRTLGDWLDEAVDNINAYGDKLSTNEQYRENKLNELIGEDHG